MKTTKKKYRVDAVYRRTKNGKYVELGYEFAGFPVDGIWLVSDGRNNQRCLIGVKESVPIHALDYRIHQDGLCRRLMLDTKGKSFSWQDVARIACDYFAELVEGKSASVEGKKTSKGKK